MSTAVRVAMASVYQVLLISQASARGPRSAHPSGLPLHEIHQDELPERHRVREVRLPLADGGDLLDELHQAPVAREHERVDHDPTAATVGDFAVGGLQDLG